MSGFGKQRRHDAMRYPGSPSPLVANTLWDRLGDRTHCPDSMGCNDLKTEVLRRLEISLSVSDIASGYCYDSRDIVRMLSV